MNSIEKFELKAEAFRIMTGMMAPGKDESPAANSGYSYKERTDRFELWDQMHGAAMRAMLLAIERVLPERTREEEELTLDEKLNGKKTEYESGYDHGWAAATDTAAQEHFEFIGKLDAERKAMPLVGYAVYSKNIALAALYRAEKKDEAFDARQRWGASITALTIHPDCPLPLMHEVKA